MNNKILIFGKGFFGTRAQQELGAVLSEKKIFTLDDAQAEIDKFSPKVVLNCVGYIGRNVDDCEANKDKALTANTIVPLILGEVCLRNQLKLVHISTGCIYNYDYAKDTPISEEQPPDFFGLYYSRTKIYAEQALLFLVRKIPVLIIRPRVPVDDRPSPKNLLTKLITTKKVIDLPNSVTYVPDFIRALKYLLEIDATGIFNLVNKNPLCYPELMDVYKKYLPDFNYEVIDYKKLNLVRTNLVLSTKKLENTGFKIRDIHEVLEECVRQYIKNS